MTNWENCFSSELLMCTVADYKVSFYKIASLQNLQRETKYIKLGPTTFSATKIFLCKITENMELSYLKLFWIVQIATDTYCIIEIKVNVSSLF